MKQLKIAIDARAFKRKGSGISQYIYEFVTRLALQKEVDTILFCRRGIKKDDFNFKNNSNIKIINLETDTSSPTSKNVSDDHNLIPKLLKKNEVNLYHAMANWGTAVTDQKICQILTVHDLIPFNIREAQFLDTRYFSSYKKIISESIENTDAIITISNYSKKEMEKRFKSSTQKISVIYNGADPGKSFEAKNEKDEIVKKLGLCQGKYFIYIGGFYERKNLSNLIKAFKIFLKTNPEYKLTITGNNSENEYAKNQYKKFISLIEPIKDSVKYLGFLDIEDKNQLIKNSAGLVYPSLCEGFGLPVIEGMYLEVPVLSSSATSLPEVGGSVPFYFNPRNINSIVSTMETVLAANPLELKRRIKEGKKRAELFTWDRAFEQTYLCYKKALKQKTKGDV